MHEYHVVVDKRVNVLVCRSSTVEEGKLAEDEVLYHILQ
jgi:hypothetical protein